MVVSTCKSNDRRGATSPTRLGAAMIPVTIAGLMPSRRRQITTSWATPRTSISKSSPCTGGRRIHARATCQRVMAQRASGVGRINNRADFSDADRGIVAETRGDLGRRADQHRFGALAAAGGQRRLGVGRFLDVSCRRRAVPGIAVSLDPGGAGSRPGPQHREEALVEAGIAGPLVAPVDVAARAYRDGVRRFPIGRCERTLYGARSRRLLDQ
jgi:hypothetical protein